MSDAHNNPLVGRNTQIDYWGNRLSRHQYGVGGYYGISGIGKTALLRKVRDEILSAQFTPYVVWLDLSQTTLHKPEAIFGEILTQLEATGKTTKITRKMFGLRQVLTPSPLLGCWQLAQDMIKSQINFHQMMQISADQATVAGNQNIVNVNIGYSLHPQMNNALNQFAFALQKLPVLPPIADAARNTTIHRPVVMLFVDEFSKAPSLVKDWLCSFTEPHFAPYLMLFIVGQEHDPRFKLQSLPPLDTTDATQLLFQRGLPDENTINIILRVARGIPLCLHLAADFILGGGAAAQLDASLPDNLSDHLVSAYLQKKILHLWQEGWDALPITQKRAVYLLQYACILRSWTDEAVLRAIMAVPPTDNLFDAQADIGKALAFLRERSFMDGQQPSQIVRELLEHDLRTHYADLWRTLHHCAATATTDASEKIYHWQCVADTASITAFWDERLAQRDKPAVTIILLKIPTQAHIPFETLVRYAQSSLLVENLPLVVRYLTSLLSIVNSLAPEQQTIVHALFEQALLNPALPSDLHYQIKIYFAQQSGDNAALAHARYGLGEVRRLQNEYGAAAVEYEAALALYAVLGDRLGMANARCGLGEVRLYQDEYGAAIREYEAALALYAALGDRWGMANARRGLGDVRRLEDEYGAAAGEYAAALALYEAL